MMDLNLPVGFYSRWAPDVNTPPFSAGLVTVHGGDNTRGCQSVPNVNIPETKTIAYMSREEKNTTYQEK